MVPPYFLNQDLTFHKQWCSVNVITFGVDLIICNLVFQNEEIFVEFNELDEFYRITHAWIGSNFSLTQAQKTLSCSG